MGDLYRSDERQPSRRAVVAGILSLPVALLLPSAVRAGTLALHRVIHAFAEGASQATPIEASDGHLYGLTDPPRGVGEHGILYRVNHQGRYRDVYRFRQQHHSPFGRLVEKDGALYGVTRFGGAFNFGTIFRLGPDRVFTVLDSFSTETSKYPYSLMITLDGRFFGTADSSIFAFVDGKIEKAVDLLGSSVGPLIEASDGHLYTASVMGGNHDTGAVLRFTPGAGLTEIYSFGPVGSGDGVIPQGALLEGADGALYGMTGEGGENGVGTVYRLTLDGQQQSLVHSFSGWDGGGPTGGLVQDAAGNFYGVTAYGGRGIINDSGTAFRIRTDGVFESLYSWLGTLDGRHPTGLLLGSDGRLYGTTESGEFEGGTLFALTLQG